MLASVFVLLAACGGANDPAAEVAAGMLFARQLADHLPTLAAADLIGSCAAADLAAAGAIAHINSAARPQQLLAATATRAAAPAGTGPRDPLRHPFASNSIWNMPIGEGARYVAAKLSGTPGDNIWAGMPYIDEEKIVLRPSAPLTRLHYNSAAWSGKDRCKPSGGLVVSVPMPSNYIVPDSTENNSAVFLMPDQRTIVQTQPLTRCTAGAPGTSMAMFANVDLYGNGVTGAHGGSGLSALGGSIRLGELRPGSATGPRHALKVNVYAKAALFRCTRRRQCFRWPAVAADSDAVGSYGSANHNRNTAMKMGALLAIPYSTPIASLNLETAPARQLAWTLQNYGAYIVDDTSAPGFALNVEDGPDGSKRAEFKADWGFDMAQKVADNTAWRRDMQKLVEALHVVDNNSPRSIGGGGAPRQPLAAPLAPITRQRVP